MLIYKTFTGFMKLNVVIYYCFAVHKQLKYFGIKKKLDHRWPKATNLTKIQKDISNAITKLRQLVDKKKLNNKKN